MRKYIKIIMIAFAFFICGFAVADTTNNSSSLNQVVVAVTDRSAPALQLALQSAFAEVLSKMSENPDVMTLPAIQKASANLTQWVQSYSYIEQPGANSQAAPTLMLQVIFDQAGLQQLLQTTTKTVPKSSSAAQGSTITMVVSGVKSIADYVQVMHALREKNDVAHVSVNDVKSDSVSLQIKISGSIAQFQKLLSMDNNFKSNAAEGSLLANQSHLDYYWVGNQA